METTTGSPVFSSKSRTLLCISSLAVTPPPGESISSTTATTLGSEPAWRSASVSPSGVEVGTVPPKVSSAGAITPSMGTTTTLSGPLPDTYSSSYTAGAVGPDAATRMSTTANTMSPTRPKATSPPTTKGHRRRLPGSPACVSGWRDGPPEEVSIPLPSSLCVFVGPTSTIAHANHHGNYREVPGRTGLSRSDSGTHKG